MKGEYVFANIVYLTDADTGRILLRAMPLMVGVLGILAIAYRYYSAFLAARVATLSDLNRTPAHTQYDGANFHPTNKWVLFGHHFAAISGAGPLIGPVLAMQFGYAPGLIWLIVGVCLAGAVQDMLVLAVSTRSGGKSLAGIAKEELGSKASLITTMAILLIVIIALAGLAFIIVKALGGEEGKLPENTRISIPMKDGYTYEMKDKGAYQIIQFGPGATLTYPNVEKPVLRQEGFIIRVPSAQRFEYGIKEFVLPKGTVQLIEGSSWGTFTIACTIPIALFVGLWMYRIRKDRIIEASIIGGVMVLAAVVAGAWIPHSPMEKYFALSRDGTVLALCIYGFIAAVLPVWLLLTPRDYLSSFMKIGTLFLLVAGVIIANPVLYHPPVNHVFDNGTPTFPLGGIFPFVFICIMCGAVSGFHSLVSSGTTPKMVDKETDVRMIGYGAMLMEGLVGLVALIAAAAMPLQLYYDINIDIDKAPQYAKQLTEIQENYAFRDPIHQVGVRDVHQLDLGQMEENIGGESLRGRTGGAVTLAVSMAMILTQAFSFLDIQVARLMKYWYHFAIMFEALFILTTIDAGTRIARYLFQEAMGKVIPAWGSPKSVVGGCVATFIVTLGWGGLVYTGQIETIWPMFGIANQLLAVLALALVTTYLVNHGKARYAWVTILPMLFVTTTTLTAGKLMVAAQWANIQNNVKPTMNTINMGMTLLVVLLVMSLVMLALSRWLAILFRPKAKVG